MKTVATFLKQTDFSIWDLCLISHSGGRSALNSMLYYSNSSHVSSYVLWLALREPAANYSPVLLLHVKPLSTVSSRLGSFVSMKTHCLLSPFIFNTLSIHHLSFAVISCQLLSWAIVRFLPSRWSNSYNIPQFQDGLFTSENVDVICELHNTKHYGK